MRLIFQIFVLGFVSYLITGCNDNLLPTSNEPITFLGNWNDTMSKGLNPLIESELNTMGVFAGYETDDESFNPSSPANDYINNIRYTRSFIYEPFAGAEMCYWPFTGKLSFFAYAPYISNTYLFFSPDYVSGYPILTYSPIDTVSLQPDFCIANPVLDQTMTTSAIPLYFHHTLSQILFSANYQGNMPATTADLYVKVDSIRIYNVIGTKNITVSNSSPCFVWQDDSECTEKVSYLIDRTRFFQVADSSLRKSTISEPDNFTNLSTTNGRMYLLPQSMVDSDAYLEVTYGYYEMTAELGETLRSSITTTCQLPAFLSDGITPIVWEPAKIYRYRFTINLDASSIVNPAVSVEQWQDVDNTSSAPKHIE